MSHAELVVADTQRWLQRAVIGLNLCPFAKAVLAKGQVHFAVCEAAEPQDMLDAFERELLALSAADPRQRDTTLLVLPAGVDDFLAFEALTARAEKLLRRHRLEGVLQL